jgi:hypothetical protein
MDRRLGTFTVLRRSIFAVTIYFFAVGFPNENWAQVTTQMSAGPCSPNVANVAGNVQFTFKCDLVDRYEYQISGDSAGILARHYDITLAAVTNFFKALTGENVPPYEAAARLEELVVKVRTLEKQLATFTVGDELKPLWDKARQALRDGDLPQADTLFTQLLDERLRITRETQQRRQEEDRKAAIETVRIIIGNGDIKTVRHQFEAAAAVYKQGLELLPADLTYYNAELRVRLSEVISFGASGDKQASASEAVAATASLIETEPTLRLRALANQLRVYSAKDLNKAVQLFEGQIRPLLNKDGVQADQVAFCYSCLARVLNNAEKYAAAHSVLQEGIAQLEKRLAPPPAGLASLYHNLSVALDGVKKPAEAEVALSKATDLFLRAYKDGMAPDVVAHYVQRGRRAKSEEEEFRYRARAFEIATQILKPTNSIYTLALEAAIKTNRLLFEDNTIKQGFQKEEVIKATYLQHLENIKKSSSGSDLNLNLAEGQAGFGNIFINGSRYELATPYLLECIKTAEVHGLESETIGMAVFNAAQLISDEPSNDTESERLLKRALTLYTKFKGPLHPQTFDVRQATAYFYATRGRSADAALVLAAFDDDVARQKPSDALAQQRKKLEAITKLKKQ